MRRPIQRSPQKDKTASPSIAKPYKNAHFKLACAAALMAGLTGIFASCGGDDSQTSTQGTGTQGAGGSGGGSAGCSPGTSEACYSGPENTLGVGICMPGTRVCADDGSAFGPCMGEVVPALDDCKTEADEDCDGVPAVCAGEAYWAKSAGDGTDQRVSAVAYDGAGNVIIAGNFVGSIDLGTGPLQSAGGTDIFVAKLDSMGNTLWSQRFGAVADQTVNAIAVDAMDHIWLTGEFQNAVDFGGGSLKSGGIEDMFVAHLDGGGTHVFSQGYGGTGFQSGRSIAVGAQQQIILLATVENTIDFGGGALASQGSTDIALAALGQDGSHAWSKIFGGATADTPSELAVHPGDAKGEITLTGGFTGTIDFGNGPMTGNGGNDVFLARIASDGSPIWSKSFGDIGEQSARAIATDASGNVLLAGAFLGNLDLGGGALSSMGSEDIFVAKFNAMGDHLWSKSFGDASQQVPRAIAVDTKGRVFITGSVAGSADFGGGPLTSAGLTDAFLAEFDENGSPLFSRLYGNDDDQSGRDLAADPKGNAIVLGGFFRGEIDFTTAKLVSAGAFDLFAAKLAP